MAAIPSGVRRDYMARVQGRLQVIATPIGNLADLSERAREALAGSWPRGRKPALWDGHTARRAAESLERRL